MKVMPRPTAARTGLRVRVYFTITQPQGLTEKVPDWGSGDLHANSASEELWGLIFFFFFGLSSMTYAVEIMIAPSVPLT